MMAGVAMSFMILEVDGSIHNPIVLAALVLWCVLVALVHALPVSRLRIEAAISWFASFC
jgi:hypothetical protein